MTVSSAQPRPGRRRAPGGTAHWAILALFAVLACALSWPVIAHLSTRVPGTATWAFDESTFLWNDWYFKHSLIDLHTSPLHSGLIWYPLGIDLIVYTYNFFNAALALPLQLAANLPLASNVTLLLATALSGFGAYLLALYVLRTSGLAGEGKSAAGWSPAAARAAALLAGLIYAFGSNRAIYTALGHYNMATTEWVPFYTLYLLRILRGHAGNPRAARRDAVLAGLFFALAALADMIYASFLALMSLVLLAAFWRGLQARWAALGRLALAGLVAAVIWSPALVPIAREFVGGHYAVSGWGESVPLSADLAGLFTPTELNPLLGPQPPAATLQANAAAAAANGSPAAWQTELRLVTEDKGLFGDINTVFLGFVTLALALVAACVPRVRRLAQPWTWTALVFGIFSLGPLLQVYGRYRFSLDNLLGAGGVTFPLPFALLHYIPFINANRAPNRNSVILMLALALMAACGAAWLLTRIAGRSPAAGRRSAAAAVAGVLAAAILVEHLALPLPTTDATVPAIYQQIAAEPGNFAIMQLPLGWRDSFETYGSESTLLQYYQTVHGKPIIGGNISRAPAFKLDYFRRIPLFQALTSLEMYQEVPADVDKAARAQAASLMALYDVRYFITFPPIPGRVPYSDTAQRTQDYALSVLPLEKQPIWEQNGVRAYRVIQPPIAFPFRLDLGTAGTEPYLGQGWDLTGGDQPYGATANWATGTAAELYLPLSEPRDLTLSLQLAPFSYQGAPAQQVTVSVNGTQVLARHALTAGWQTLAVKVPVAATRRGPNVVTLQFAWAASPRQVLSDPAGRGVIGGTGIVSPVNIDVHGFTNAFISTFDAAGSETKSSVDRRGYDVVVIDPAGGKVLDSQGFDTAANEYETARLADYLAAIPKGRIVALATHGDATAHVTPALVAVLRGLGSRVQSPADLAGQAQALVGVQGAAAGSAAETIQPGDAFVRVAGDFRTLSAALDWAELAP